MMNSIQKVVVRALCAVNQIDSDCTNCDGEIQQFEALLDNGSQHIRRRNCPYRVDCAVAITAFLEAAAKEGWHMRPDEATEEMLEAYRINATAGDEGPKECYYTMLVAAPPFEWRE